MESVRLEAFIKVGELKLNDPSIIFVANQDLKSPDTKVVLAALHVLAVLTPANDASEVAILLRHPDPSVKSEALFVLATMYALSTRTPGH